MSVTERFSDLSVLLVDDHALIRQACRELLQRAGIARFFEAADGEEAYRIFVEQAPSLVVLDLSMARLSGLECLRRMLVRKPAARVVVFSMHDDPLFAARALRAGACGYVTKTSPPEDLVTAVRVAVEGGRHLSHDVAVALVNARLDAQQRPLEVLSAREFEVFRLCAEGRNTAEIGELLSITAKSAANLIGRIRDKLGARNAAELVKIAIESGIVSTVSQVEGQ